MKRVFAVILRFIENSQNDLQKSLKTVLLKIMIQADFLNTSQRVQLIEVARNGLSEHRVARRANALILLDRGMSCEDVGSVLLLDDDTVRTCYRNFKKDGIEGLVEFGYVGSVCQLSVGQQEKLTAWIGETLPRSTREVGAWIEREFGITYQCRSGLINLLHRLGMEHRKPQGVSRKLDEAKQRAFIEGYNALLKTLSDDEAVMFAPLGHKSMPCRAEDAVHPTHGARPVGCWAPKETKVAIDQTSGRQRLNMHGAIDLETGKTRILDVLTVNAMSTIALLMAIENLYPTMRLIHVFLDNASYHHAKIVREWLTKPGCRIKLHFIPPYCPHLNPIERLWGLMHRNITHNRCYSTFNDFCDAMLDFTREVVPNNWSILCDSVSDNFRVISPKDFRILK